MAEQTAGGRRCRPIWRVIFLGVWTAAIVALAGAALGAAPQYHQQFAAAQVQLPCITAHVLGVSSWLAGHWFVLPAAWAFVGAIFATGILDRATPLATLLVLLAGLAGVGLFIAAFSVSTQAMPVVV